MFTLLKEGIPWETLQGMSDNEIMLLDVVSEEIGKLRQDLIAARS